MRSPGARRVSDQRLERSAAKRHRFDLYVLTRHPATPDEWLAAMRATIAGVEAVDFQRRRTAHLEWWRGFWGRGAYPIKSNGSLFTVPWPGQPGDADYRRWGPGYWWQNTRLPYAPLLASGDLDLLQPFHRIYAGDVLAVSQYRTSPPAHQRRRLRAGPSSPCRNGTPPS